MPILQTVSSSDYAPGLDFPKQQAQTAKQRVAAEQFIATLPGNTSGPRDGELRRIATDISHIGQTLNRKLQFVVDQQSKEVLVKVIDKSTDKVIKVLPPEELQRLHRRLKETIGFLFNEKV